MPRYYRKRFRSFFVFNPASESFSGLIDLRFGVATPPEALRNRPPYHKTKADTGVDQEKRAARERPLKTSSNSRREGAVTPDPTTYTVSRWIVQAEPSPMT
jgi:hypothetical protein